jgi:two-component system, cell cycle response regulator
MSQEDPPKTERRVMRPVPMPLEPNHPCLQILQGASAGRLVRLDKEELTIGRSPNCRLRLEDTAISWCHASIRCEGDDFFLQDLESTNGTFLNGKTFQGSVPLRPGAMVSLAQAVSLRLSLLSEGEISLAEKLYKNATTDSLTGLLNRTSFFSQAEQEVALFGRTGRGFGLLMLDLDFFKKVNDNFGHPAGDDLLAQVSRLLRQHLRLEDLLARVGGEEFSILLRSADEIGCLDVAERLRKEVANCPFHLHTSAGSVEHTATLSIGVAYIRPEDDLGQLVDRADEALYKAKSQGRNRACAS